MSESEADSAKSPSADSKTEGGEQDEIANYAQTAINEMLGWYGLQDYGNDASDPHRHLPPCGLPLPPLKPAGATSNGQGESGALNGWETRINGPKTENHKSEGSYSNPESPTGDSRRGNSRKFIGMRYLFPAPAESATLLQKARIWVERHNHKYFVGWSEEQLSNVDTILRPLLPITPDMYKLHMNRSEYCRNVKLKYCLESDAEWAQEFREKLSNPLCEGGFSGLCQAKIVAAELWRKYSENYKGHQARYPNPKSRYRPRRSDNGHGSPPAEGGVKLEEDLWSSEGFEEGDGCEGEEEWCGSRCHSTEDSPPACKVERDTSGPDMPLAEPLLKIPLANNNNNLSSSNHCPSTPHSAAEHLPLVIAPRTLSSPATSETMLHGLQASSLAILTTSALSALHQVCPTAASNPAVSLPAGLALPSTPNVSPSPSAPGQTALRPGSPQLISPSPSDDGRNHKTPFRPGEYKKSERGLSYLFPSLSDQQLSLLDKVRITVLRHKNNYFLDWTPSELAQVAPIVRPKMVVTRELYKEYCHRNAMKYDSNLQFAMETTEPWAEDFRLRLSCPPSEGGFHSLCEVKQEAGRLWREYSGRYKMHNVVKAQMDRNIEASQGGRVEVKMKGRRSLEQQRSAKDVQAALEELYRAGYATGSIMAADGLLPACPSPALQRSTSLGPSPSLSPSSTATEASNDDSSRKRRLDEPSKEEDVKSARLDHQTPTSPWDSALSSPLADYPLRSDLQQREAMAAALRAASELFPPLPAGLHVSQQVAVWLERHQQAYFLSVPLETLSPLIRPHVRPRLTVTESLYQRFMSALASHLHQLMLVMASSKAAAVVFQKALAADQYDSLETVLMEAMEVWNKHVSADHTELAHSAHNKQVKSEPAVSPALIHSVLSVPEVKPMVSYNGDTNSSGADSSLRNNQVGPMPALLKVQLPQRNPAPSHPAPKPSNDLSQDVLDLSMSSSSQPPAPTAPAPTPTSSKKCSTLEQIWKLRNQLQASCRDDPAKSLHTRLQEHAGLLRQQLGGDYQLPSNQSDCLVDLMLASVHKHLTQT